MGQQFEVLYCVHELKYATVQVKNKQYTWMLGKHATVVSNIFQPRWAIIKIKYKTGSMKD
jgi:hypothetical protein